MAAVTIGDSALVFGSTDETWGLIQNLSFAEAVQVTEAEDADGDVVGAAMWGNKTTVTGTYLFKSDTNAPTSLVGSATAVTLSDGDSPGDIHITSATTNKDKNSFKSIDFEGTYYPNLGS